MVQISKSEKLPHREVICSAVLLKYIETKSSHISKEKNLLTTGWCDFVFTPKHVAVDYNLRLKTVNLLQKNRCK